MSESNQNTPDPGEDNRGTENNTGNQTKNDNNKNNTTYNPHNKGGGKTRKQYNEHQSLQYEGKNPEIGGILALRNENFSKKVPFSVFQQQLKNHILTEFDYDLSYS